MQLNRTIKLVITLALTLISFTTISYADDVSSKHKSKKYSEDQFLQTFSGKSKKDTKELLGEPAKKELSVKPTNASEMLAGKGQESSKPVNVEMWYYNGVVSYAPKKTYKFAELTFVNDRCMNIAFFNTK